ncbi:MAG TPA: transcriptional regulator, partial [Firmicutes bacterium]|nr:transcriptional regulator [Bacillota bacterium]
DTMFDLAGQAREEISPDLPDYIMNKPSLRIALRKARQKGAKDDFWKEVIKKLDEQ